MTTILSIQSSVAYGHVGNSAAAFALMRMGVETYPVLTVHYSNTTAYQSWRGPALKAGEVADVIRGVDERGALTGVDAVLTGYQGTEEMGQTILDAVALVKRRNPAAVYCCDPVMGDVGRGFYVASGIPDFLRQRVVPEADIVTPNQFELDFLTDRQTRTMADLLAAADQLIDLGPKTVLVTSAITEDGDLDTIKMVAVRADQAWQVTTPKLERAFTGSGDVTAAVFLANLLRDGDLGQALAQTAAVVYSVLAATAASGQRELRLVQAQDEIVSPSHRFEAVRLR
ncbi:MAG: pyridoxal kinase PdxY [Propionibacteriaceae bacterium]|jgi:pyridoxine kinase|nr:pyridoxal kinase PdxY [Propionibacteriaceae bacterium]